MAFSQRKTFGLETHINKWWKDHVGPHDARSLKNLLIKAWIEISENWFRWPLLVYYNIQLHEVISNIIQIPRNFSLALPSQVWNNTTYFRNPSFCYSFSISACTLSWFLQTKWHGETYNVLRFNFLQKLRNQIDY